MLCLHHKPERALIYQAAEVDDALQLASATFARTKFEAEPRGEGYALRMLGGPISRWIADV